MLEVERVALDPAGTFDATIGPTLVSTAKGNIWLVTTVDGAQATARLWQMLEDPKTFAK